jgi:ABC-2 type transport system permease protein
MTALTNIIRKELRELLTPSTVIPIVLMALVFGAIGSMTGNIAQQATAKPIVGVVPMDHGVLANISLSCINQTASLVYNGTSVNAGLQNVSTQEGIAVLYIPANFTSSIMGGHHGNLEVYWIMRGAGLLDSISSTTVDALIGRIGQEISAYLIGTGVSLPPSIVLAPVARVETTYFRNVVMQGVSPSTLSNVLSGQSLIVPIIIMMIVIMAGSLVISSMGMEKENKTLETLLTLPVSRSSIVAGKLIASAIVGLLMAGIYMIGFGYYMGGLSGNTQVNLAAYGLAITPVDYVLLGLSVFASLFAALALCMVLGTFAKNYKAAQTLTMPVTLLAMLPMFMTMFFDYSTLPPAAQAIVFAIPFSHPMMAMRSLMFKDYLFVLSGIAYSLVFAVIMIFIAVWIFRTDRLLTGRFTKGQAGAGSRRGIWRFVNLPHR